MIIKFILWIFDPYQILYEKKTEFIYLCFFLFISINTGNFFLFISRLECRKLQTHSKKNSVHVNLT